ncbi:MAG: HD domain-containing protein [Candidatus Moranbacteria bacterium]|nr:HD domain-containing protein [Candidatus Moranbacteria bacterium]
MDKAKVIDKTIEFVKEELKNAESGHDWWHIYRVWKLSKHIAKDEKVNLFIVELGALLHDIADSKFHDGDETIGPKKARNFLQSLNVDEEIIDHIGKIIDNISFKGGSYVQNFKSLELGVVQDADRLDAMGAMGIARTFNYGGYINSPLHDPSIKSNLNMNKEEYKKGNSTTVNHFYEKLLLLKDRMNTETGRKIAEHRHEFMKQYLDEFYKEWEGKL